MKEKKVGDGHNCNGMAGAGAKDDVMLGGVNQGIEGLESVNNGYLEPKRGNVVVAMGEGGGNIYAVILVLVGSPL